MALAAECDRIPESVTSATAATAAQPVPERTSLSDGNAATTARQSTITSRNGRDEMPAHGSVMHRNPIAKAATRRSVLSRSRTDMPRNIDWFGSGARLVPLAPAAIQ